MKRTRGEQTASMLVVEPQPQSPPEVAVDDDRDDVNSLTTDVAPSFSPEYATYLASVNIDPTLLALTARQLPRYIRINPRITPTPTVDSLSTELNAQLHPTTVPNVYRISSSSPLALASSASYKQGSVYGIDLASVLAVCAVSLPTAAPSASPAAECLHVLDMCCAPGAKLTYLHDLLTTEWQGPFTLTGVDVSLPRLSSCRNVLHKYKCSNTTLYLADGRTFAQPPPPPPSPHDMSQPSGPSHPLLSPYVIHDLTNATDGHSTLHLTKRQKKALRRKQPNTTPPLPPHQHTTPHSPTIAHPSTSHDSGYHRILVDAQCSHDGSVRHLVKQSTHTAPHLSHSRGQGAVSGDELVELQRGLLVQGWSLLRVGGVLVYSTCSTQRQQNEDVVEWLIERQQQRQHTEGVEGGGVELCSVFSVEEGDEVSDEEERRLLEELRARAGAQSGDALLVEVESATNSRLRWKRGLPWTRLTLPQECVRLSPLISGTSGLFIAKLRKLS